VQIFFAVSGYLITSTSLRLARIAPLLALLLAILTALHYTQSPWFHVSDKVGGLARALSGPMETRYGRSTRTLGEWTPLRWDA